jgi:hypothetical protein
LPDIMGSDGAPATGYWRLKMDMVVKRKIAAAFASGLLAAVLAAAPARADDDTLFGQPAPKRFLLNKMLDPKNTHNPGDEQAGGGAGQAASGNGQVPAGSGQAVPGSGQAAGSNGKPAAGNGKPAAGNGQVAAGEASEDEDDGPGPFPRRYLLNKMFDGSK